MAGVLNLLVAMGFGPITIPTNWGVSAPAASPQTSATKTLSVPPGNPGSVKLHYTAAPAGTGQYIKNGGAPTTFTVDTVVAFVNGDTLAFKLTGSSGDSCSILVTDNTLGNTIGTCTLQIA
jgi:archaellum component FlaG (FlaF/FlaG flagellin family)